MAEELQSLLDKIQRDGVEKAESEATRITTAATDEAAEIVAAAEKKAQAIVAQAKTDGEAFAVRGRQSLDQAARDVILSLRDSINATLATLVRKETAEALKNGALVKILEQVVAAYCDDTAGNTPVELLLPADLQDRIRNHFFTKLDESVRSGLEIKADSSVLAGFRVSLTDEQVEHDFTDSAIAEAMCKILRPRLAETVKEAIERQP